MTVSAAVSGPAARDVIRRCECVSAMTAADYFGRGLRGRLSSGCTSPSSAMNSPSMTAVARRPYMCRTGDPVIQVQSEPSSCA